MVSSREEVCYDQGVTTKSSAGKLSFDRPARYRIRVQGRIEERWSERFEGMAISPSAQDDEPPVTTLVGELTDQAALVGVLNTLYGLLHLPLLSVQCLSSQMNNERESN